MHSTIIFPGSWVSDFAENSRARKFKGIDKAIGNNGRTVFYQGFGLAYRFINISCAKFILFFILSSLHLLTKKSDYFFPSSFASATGRVRR